MILLHGKHTVNNGNTIEDLETIEMIGTEQAYDVVQLFSTIELINITTTYIGSLTLTEVGSIVLSDNVNGISTNQRKSSQTKVSVNRAMCITINGTLFSGVYLNNFLLSTVNINIVMVNSNFTNRSTVLFP